MADDNKNDIPPGGPRQPQSGPVKPPVLEGTARKMGSETKTEPKSDETASASKPAKPEPKTSASSPSSAASAGTGTSAGGSRTPPNSSATTQPAAASGGSPWLAGLVGGVIGLAAAYGLAYAGLWPAQPVPEQQPDQRIGQLAAQLPELKTVTNTVQDELSTLDGRVAALEKTPTTGTPDAQPKLGDLSDQLAALTQRLTAVEAAAGPDAQSQPSEAVTTLQTELDAVRQQAQSLADRLDQTQQSLGDLGRKVANASQSDGAEARLPLIVSGLETAFDTGRAFAPELASLRTALPDLDIPQTIAAAADSGLPRPDLVARHFDQSLPDVLAGRPAPADASWQDAAGNWFRGLIALRPSAGGDGTEPEAVVSRIEEALSRRDFAAANADLEALPQPMQQAAGQAATEIATLAQARQFLDDVRSAALAGENGA